MADLDFTVNADTGGASRSLQQLERNVGSLGDAFGKLKGAVAGLIAASTIKGLFDMSNALADLSATTGVSIQAIAGLGESLAQNSGSFEQANNAILKFTETLGNAVQGNDKTRESFAQIGVSLEDLRTLSEQDLLRKTIIGLGQVTDISTRASLASDLFGKSLRGADLAGVARDLDRITEGQARFAQTAATAGEVNQQLQNSFRKVQAEILVALQPLAELAAKLLENQQAVQNFIESAVSLGKVLLGLFIFSKVSGWIYNMVGSLRAVSTASGAAGASLSVLAAQGNVFANFKLGLVQITQAFNLKNAAIVKSYTGFGILGLTIRSLAGGFARLIPGLGLAYTAFEAINLIIKQLTGTGIVDWLDRAGKSVANFFGIAYKTSKEKEKLDKEAADRAKKDAQEQTDRAERQLAETEKAKKLAEERKKEEERIAEAFRTQLQNLRASINAYAEASEQTQRRIRQETELIGLTEEQKTMRQTMFDLENNYLREITRLVDLYAEKSQSSKQEDIRMLPQIQKALQDVTAQYQAQIEPVMALTREKLRALDVEKQRLELEKQVESITNFGNKSRLEGERKIRDLQAEIAKSTMPELEKKYFDLSRAAEESARSAIEAENDRRRALKQPLMSGNEEAEYYKRSAEGLERLKALTKEQYSESRKFSTGWKTAFQEYADNATNAARNAANIFGKFTQGMEDAIVSFVKTGKFEFKGFVNMMLEELLRSQIRQVMAGLFTGGVSGGSSGLLGGKIIPGILAGGGPVSSRRPYIVGEQGPELFVPNSAGTMMPNRDIGGGTSVTYNINAVDAPSFQALIARDPSFIHAVAMQGAKGTPRRR
jgi:lambda family phage tail tape measure protein